MSAKIEGADELLRKLQNMSQDMQVAAAKRAAVAGGTIVKRQAQLLVPRNAGALARSIRIRSSASAAGAKAEVYTNYEYAIYVEFGTGPKGQANHQGISPSVTPRYTQHGWGIPADQVSAEDAEKYHWPSRIYDGKTYYMTSGQAASPFMYPALNNRKEDVKKAMNASLRASIKKEIR